jgi:WD40 repeat protein
VVFDQSGNPLQLLIRDGPSLQLWNVKEQHALGKYQLPVSAQPDSQDQSVAEVVNIALSADGSLLAATVEFGAEDADKSAKAVVAVWQAKESRPWRVFEKRATVLAIAPSGASSLLAAGDERGKLTIWALDSGQETASLQSSRNAILTLAFDRDRRRLGGELAPANQGGNWLLAAGDAGGVVTVWDTGAKIPRAFCRGSRYGVHAVAFSPDGMTLASAGRYRAKLWNVATGQLLLHLKYRNFMTGLAFSPDGRRLAVTSVAAFDNPSSVDVWKLDENRGIRLLRGLLGQITEVAISPDDRYLAALSDDWQVGIWDVVAGHLLHVLEAHKGLIADNAALAFSPDGSQLAFASGHEARLWNVADGRERKSWVLPGGLADRLAFPAKDKLLLLRVETQEGDRGPFSDAPPSQHPRVCRLRNLLGGEPTDKAVEITDFNWAVFSTALAPNGDYLVIHGRGGPEGERRLIKVFDAAGRELGKIPTRRKRSSGRSVIDPSGTRMLTPVDDSGPFLLLEMPSVRRLGDLDRNASCFSDGAKYFVTAGSPGGRAIASVADGELLVNLGIDNLTTSEAQFSSDDRLVAWGNADGTVLLCDVPAIRSRLTEIGLDW